MKDFDDSSGYEVDYDLPKRISYNLDSLSRFCREDADCVVTFYGGEPLLCIDDMKRIMDSVPAKHFMIQTNGVLLHQLEAEYVNKFHTILVSIDGDEELTDYYRGKGTYRRLVENLTLIRRNGFKGELIARMTVMEQTDIYYQVRFLLDNGNCSFSSVHWQLNAGFWKKDFQQRDFERWSRQGYNPGVRKLVSFWVDQMDRQSTVLKLYPFLGLAYSLLSDEKQSLLRCGAGWINYAIQTDGNITICPTMWGVREHYLGHVVSSSPLSLPQVLVGEPCIKCDVLNLCGGRCLYANIMKRWDDEEYRLVCDTVRNLVDAVKAQVPRICDLMEMGRISLKDFEYVRYNGCEIIP